MRARAVWWVGLGVAVACSGGCVFAPRWDVPEASVEADAAVESDAESEAATPEAAAPEAAVTNDAGNDSAQMQDVPMLRDVLQEVGAEPSREVGVEPSVEASVPDVQRADSALDALDAETADGESPIDGA